MSENQGRSAIRKWRERNGVSQRELAQRLAISATEISDYEAGRRVPGLARAFALERVTGVDAELWVDDGGR